MTARQARADVALAELKSYRQKYPNSAISDSAVEELARAALAADQPQEAAAALNSYDKAATKSSLLLLRAQAREKAAILKGEKPVSAATDYLDVIYHFPLSDEAKASIDHIPFLQLQLGEQFPGTPVDAEIARAETFYDARRWKDLRPAYEELLPKLSGAARERATLRIAQAGVQLGGSPDALASLTLTDPELDAERIYTLSQMKRAVNVENDMFANIEKLVSLYPQSPWAEQALMAAGNYEWANLDRGQAVDILPAADHPVSRRARRPGGAMAHRLDRLHGSPERRRDPPRTVPAADIQLLPTSWMRCTGSGALTSAPATVSGAQLLSRRRAALPADLLRRACRAASRSNWLLAGHPRGRSFGDSAGPALDRLAGPLPAAAIDRWTRAQALESIAFDNSAELELRAAYAETHAPQLLLAVAEAAVNGRSLSRGHRRHAPSWCRNSKRAASTMCPDDAWRTAYPLPYRDWVEREAQRNHLDPMLVAGLIRQESAFASDAVSFRRCWG